MRRANRETPSYAVFSILILIYLEELEKVLISCGNCLECHTSLQNVDYPNHNNKGLSICPAHTAHVCVRALVHGKNKISCVGKYQKLICSFPRTEFCLGMMDEYITQIHGLG